jgi:peptide/nickel transport system ATP-binding protein
MSEVMASPPGIASAVEDRLLEIEGLSVAYPTARGWLKALDDVSLSIPAGGVLGLVGESGSGKSSVVMALLGLLGASARVRASRITFDGQDLLAAAALLRGRRIGVVFQDTSAVLNPALTIGQQVSEPWLVHLRLPRKEAWARATASLAEMGIARPAQVMNCYPHQLSGGMKQRVAIATTLATDPDLLLLDEPTTALDVTVEAQILDLLDRLRARRSLSMLLVSHNLAIVDRLCDQVAVLYAGRVMETGPAARVLDRPRHPYTKGLLAALPRPDLAHPGRLSSIAGSLPDLVLPDPGCNFRPRCAFAAVGCEQPQALRGQQHLARCHRDAETAALPWPGDAVSAGPASVETVPVARAPASRTQVGGRERGAGPLLQANGLSRRFTTGGLLHRLSGRVGREVLAVDDVSLVVHAGEIVGLVGESGCGKSTLGRLLLRLISADSGMIRFKGTNIGERPDLAFRRSAQIVFQNPDTALNPRQTVGTILLRPLRRFGLAGGDATSGEIDRLLELVRLPPSYADRYPHQLSGGEKQRVGIARALATRPDFMVCDEAVSALDVSVQAAMLNLLSDLRDELGMAYLFISHDIGVIAHIADRVAVMYSGSLVEEGQVRDVLRPPYHPYTELLLRSVPVIGNRRAGVGEAWPITSADRATAVSGCKFAKLCPRKLGPICDSAQPPWQEVDRDHRIRCHIPLSTLAGVAPWLPVHALSMEEPRR